MATTFLPTDLRRQVPIPFPFDKPQLYGSYFAAHGWENPDTLRLRLVFMETPFMQDWVMRFTAEGITGEIITNAGRGMAFDGRKE